VFEIILPDRSPVKIPLLFLPALIAQAGLACAIETVWLSDQPVPNAAELTELKGVQFHVIKANEPEKDGYNWLHGVALAWHKGKLYATFGHNKGEENTSGEEARGRVSTDGGKTWGAVFTIDNDKTDGLGISHGVLLSHQGMLWAFQCSFYGRKENCHTRAYVLNETTSAWEKKGVVIENGFGPTQAPQKVANGNWIMAGRVVEQKDGVPAAVAISHGDDLMKWDLVKIPKPPGLNMYGESSVIVDGNRVQNFARIQSLPSSALTAVSEDYGRTWTEAQPSNLPMVRSKPYAGTLSTGQRYLIDTITAEAATRNHRAPLTIAVGRPGENGFRKIFRIRDSVCPESPGDSNPNGNLSYPYAIEHDGSLYIGFSNMGGRGGNDNSAELAVIPIQALKVD